MGMATEPAMKTFTWWDQVPENLKTKTQLDAIHLKPGGPPRAEIEYGKGRKHRLYVLYDVGEAIAKVATPAQLRALEQARIKQRTCSDCGTVVEKPSHLSSRTGRCGVCIGKAHDRKRSREVDATISWARSMLANPDALILDTETTDLHGYICEIAIIRMDGRVVFESLINPQARNNASHIHGITPDMTWSAPTFADIELELRRLLHGRTVVVYNAGYDSEVLESEIKRLCTPSDEALLWLIKQDFSERGYCITFAGQPRELDINRHQLYAYRSLVSEHATWWRERVTWQCAMLEYATFVGTWHDYYRNYRYQPLGGGHRAVGDCRACLQVLQRMANTPLSTELTLTMEESEKLDQEAHALQLEATGRHPDDDPAQWQRVT